MWTRYLQGARKTARNLYHQTAVIESPPVSRKGLDYRRNVWNWGPNSDRRNHDVFTWSRSFSMAIKFTGLKLSYRWGGFRHGDHNGRMKQTLLTSLKLGKTTLQRAIVWATRQIGTCTSWVTETVIPLFPPASSFIDIQNEMGASFFDEMVISDGCSRVSGEIRTVAVPMCRI